MLWPNWQRCSATPHSRSRTEPTDWRRWDVNSVQHVTLTPEHIYLILYIILWPISGDSVSFILVCVNDLFWSWSLSCEQAERQAEEYQGMRAFILGWTEKAEALVTGSIIWSSASQLQEQIRAHQVSLNESHSREWAWRRNKNWVLIHFIFTFPQK